MNTRYLFKTWAIIIALAIFFMGIGQNFVYGHEEHDEQTIFSEVASELSSENIDNTIPINEAVTEATIEVTDQVSQAEKEAAEQAPLPIETASAGKPAEDKEEQDENQALAHIEKITIDELEQESLTTESTPPSDTQAVGEEKDQDIPAQKISQSQKKDHPKVEDNNQGNIQKTANKPAGMIGEYNPDKLSEFDDSPIKIPIQKNVKPEVNFSSFKRTPLVSLLADETPKIGVNHPTDPGEVMLFKEAHEIPGKVNTWEIILRIEAKDFIKTSDIVLVIDRSGSMTGQRMTNAKAAAKEFVNQLIPVSGQGLTRIAVVSFAGDVTLNQGLTMNKTQLLNAIDSLTSSGGTLTQGGMRQGQDLLAGSTADLKNIVLLSDGQPTYSFQIPNQTVRQNGSYLQGGNYYTGKGYARSDYNDTRVGNGSNMTFRIGNTDYYYHHGNSAIAESGYAKAAGQVVWTIALEAGPTGTPVLNEMASPGKSYNATASELQQIFSEIAGSIASAAQDASVNDPMGQGFQIPAANVSDIEVSQGTASYDSANKRISWTIGTLTTPIEPGSDIKYAQLKYTIEINDDILDETPDASGEYPTNGETTITYKDANGQTRSGNFTSPRVNPVLYKLVKVVQDLDGNDITSTVDASTGGRTFTATVTGPGADGNNTVRTYQLNTKTHSGTTLMTDLRIASTYLFEETGTSNGSLNDYDITYFVNGAQVTDLKFVVVDSQTDDVEVKIVNKEKAGKLTITKVLDQTPVTTSRNIMLNGSVSFEFAVTYPNGHVENFVLPDDDGNWTKVFNQLPFGDYIVTETTTGWHTSMSVDGIVTNGSSVTVPISIANRERTVIVTNKQTQDMSLTANKIWVGGPTPPPAIWFQLHRQNMDETTLAIGMPRAVPAGNEVIWKQTDSDVNASDFVKYDNKGNEYIYFVKEVDASGQDFTPEGYEKLEQDLTVTNTYIKKISVSVQKIWEDNNNQDGTRPTEILIKLFADGVDTGQSIILNVGNSWSGSFTGLEVYENGNKIVYTVLEDPVPSGYSVAITGDMDQGFIVTNKHIPATVDIEGSKTWDDNDNQDGLRPAEITINLLKNGVIVDSKVVTEADGWTWKFEGLPKFEAGVEIVYTIEEEAIDGYEAIVDGYNVLNKHTPATVDIEGSKTWDDNDNQDGLRPTEITINLLKNGTKIDSKVVTESDGWTWKFENLPKFEAGVEIVYTITEEAVDGYEAIVEGYSVLNKHIPATVDIEGHKTWDDNDNQDGIRPTEITINLLKNGVIVESKVVTESDGWTWKFENLPKFEAGVEITYSISEEAIDGYEAIVDGYSVLNKHIPATVDIEGNKTWDDNDNQDGIRPTEITINLLKNGVIVDSKVVTESDGWTWKFENLPKFEAGVEIVYTIEEEAVDGYEAILDGYSVLNKHTPATVDIEGSKTWDDNDNQDGIRPTEIRINLLKNGVIVDSKVVTEADGWTWKFENLPKFEAGVEISYSISEEAIDGYEAIVDGYSVLNKHTPATVDIEGNKTWDDNDNQDGLRPTEITINLLKNGVIVDSKVVNESDGWIWKFENLPKFEAGVEIVYTIEEEAVDGYEAIVDGYSVLNKHIPATVDIEGNKTWDDNDNQDGIRPTEITINLLKNGTKIDSKVVTESDGWTWKFEGLPKFEAGVEIVYTIEEEAIDGYEAIVDGYSVINKHTPATVDIEGDKTWDDNDNQDGLRPTEITINLLKNGVIVDSKVVTEADGWTWKFENLPKFEAGVEIVYTIEEEAVDGYEAIVDGYSVLNKYIPATVDIEGNKTWDDNDNQDGIRPTEITINLLKNGTKIDSKVVTESDGWTWKFENLPKFEAGVEIVYTIEEEAIDGYEAIVDGYSVLNKHTPATVDIEGNKTWDDNDNQDGIRPTEITINLLKNGVIVDSKVVTEADGWTWKFEGLPKFEAGVEIVYTITEEAIANYSAEYDGYNVINKHTLGKTSVTVVKVWDDADDVDGKRTAEVVIRLYADGVDTGLTLRLSSINQWKGTFTELDEYKDGLKIVYTIDEEQVPTEYTKTITGDAIAGFTVKNSYTPQEEVEDEEDLPEEEETTDEGEPTEQEILPPGQTPTTGENQSHYWGIGMMLLLAGALVIATAFKLKKQTD